MLGQEQEDGMEDQCPYVLDRTGKDVQAESVRLHERGAVTQVELPDGVLAWSVTGHDAVRKLLTDPRFQKDPKLWPRWVDGDLPSEWQMANWVVMENMMTRDHEDHRRLRAPLAKAFSPHTVERCRGTIARLVDGFLEHLAEPPAGAVVDIKEQFCAALGTTVICELFGVPASDREAVLYAGKVNASTDITGAEAAASIEQYHDVMANLVATRQREPGDDLTSGLIAASKAEGSHLTDAELAGTLHLLIGAGSETVMNSMAHAIVNLLTHPDQKEMVLRGQISWDDVIEESLRHQSPVAMLPFRFATEDVELAGVTIHKGDPVLTGFMSVGRDPELHGPDADQFDATRADKTHMAFGYGLHFCLGAPLARLELAIALPALFNRFPDLALAAPAGELPPSGTFMMNSYGALPVRLAAPVPTPS
jgi:cytochrome P450